MNFIVEDENGREVTVWTSDNFTPGNYLPLSGGTLSGILKIKSKLFISELPGFQDTNPSITLALGDNDTGFHSVGDGEVVFYSNNRVIFNMKSVFHTGNFDPNSKLNVSGGTINGNLGVTGDFSARNISCSGRVTTQSITIAGANFDPNSKFNTSGGTIYGNVTVTGAFHSNNDVSAFSDKRIKTNIKSIDSNQDIIKLMDCVNLYSYNLLGKDKIEYGVMAQELENIFPELVTSSEGEKVVDKDGNIINPKRVMYNHFIPLLLMYTQELRSRVNELENLILKGE